MKELVIATKNKGKLREIKELLKDLDLNITSLSDYPGAPKVNEDGKTYAQNALKKAVTAIKDAKAKAYTGAATVAA